MKNHLLFIFSTLFLFCGVPLGSLAQRDSGPTLPREVVNLLFHNMCNNLCSDEEMTRWKSNLKFETHDLNGDSVPEFFLFIAHSDWCGAGSNCDYWVFQKKANGYALLLHEKELRVKETITNGYHDLASETPIGFCDLNVQRLDVTPYRFDGEKYRAQARNTDCKGPLD